MPAAAPAVVRRAWTAARAGDVQVQALSAAADEEEAEASAHARRGAACRLLLTLTPVAAAMLMLVLVLATHAEARWGMRRRERGDRPAWVHFFVNAEKNVFAPLSLITVPLSLLPFLRSELETSHFLWAWRLTVDLSCLLAHLLGGDALCRTRVLCVWWCGVRAIRVLARRVAPSSSRRVGVAETRRTTLTSHHIISTQTTGYTELSPHSVAAQLCAGAHLGQSTARPACSPKRIEPQHAARSIARPRKQGTKKRAHPHTHSLPSPAQHGQPHQERSHGRCSGRYQQW